ncbi:cytochrome c biogenesis heme-transporting ATPase CcmA [Alteromonas sp. 5E99-2]|uniref:cytochrome c biogenesis heme-transporting ATPase CcmA n=1 Tax=Alteromonas sp. 5E99-2 TaxID=2817683 RepID=UPI001A99F6F2|nr:cytochrome c biogenesis heme-transporting ATPase CcmA [Alteromonas sp. 5E99-2]MBO1254165.1 cytochrome c biogenesis heme-transporting ATPase CcmA [Alteromonas sp. 5E99-2]
MHLISANQLTCIKRDRVLFENLNLDVTQGEIVHVVGENGAGKTSLLRILVGLALPSNGEIYVQGNPLTENPEMLHKILVFIGHKSSINGQLTAVENTLFWLKQQGIEGNSDEIERVLSQLGLAGVDDIPVNALSAGQQRRVALSRLWLKPNAKLWVLDEPFTALDKSGIDVINQRIHSFVEQGGTVVLTSHQPLRLHEKIRKFAMEYRF